MQKTSPTTSDKKDLYQKGTRTDQHIAGPGAQELKY